MVKLCVICPNPLTDTIESFLRKSCHIKSWTVRWRKQDYQADRNEGWRLLLEILSRGRMQLPFPSHPFQLTLSHFEPESGSLMLSVLSLSRCECRPYYCLCRCCCCSKVHYPCDCCCCSTGMRESMANNPSQNYIWLITAHLLQSTLSDSRLETFSHILNWWDLNKWKSIYYHYWLCIGNGNNHLKAKPE